MNQVNLQRVLNSVFDVNYDDDLFDHTIKDKKVGRDHVITHVVDSIAEVKSEHGYEWNFEDIKKYDFLLGIRLNNINRIVIDDSQYDFRHLWIYSDKFFDISNLRKPFYVKNLAVKAPAVGLSASKMRGSIIECDTLTAGRMSDAKKCDIKYKHLQWYGSLEGIDKVLGFKIKKKFKYDYQVSHELFLKIKQDYKSITKQQAREFFGDLFCDDCKKITIMDCKTFSYGVNGRHGGDFTEITVI